MWTKPVGKNDMTALRDISDAAIAENLKERLKAGIIYVSGFDFIIPLSKLLFNGMLLLVIVYLCILKPTPTLKAFVIKIRDINCEDL